MFPFTNHCLQPSMFTFPFDFFFSSFVPISLHFAFQRRTVHSSNFSWRTIVLSALIFVTAKLTFPFFVTIFVLHSYPRIIRRHCLKKTSATLLILSSFRCLFHSIPCNALLLLFPSSSYWLDRVLPFCLCNGVFPIRICSFSFVRRTFHMYVYFDPRVFQFFLYCFYHTLPILLSFLTMPSGHSNLTF